MRVSLDLDDALVRDVDAMAGVRRRAVYVREALLRALQADRAEAPLSVAGALSDSPHSWDDDAGAWVSAQRRAEAYPSQLRNSAL